MRHHTKDKGDTGLGFVVACLLSKGVQVALPISEHLPFDCIAISEKNELCRLSVKFRSVKNGRVEVQFRGCWNDRHGTHIRKQDTSLYDATAIYCPETKECYFIRNNEAAQRSFALRLEPPKNGQKEGVRFAGEYTNPHRLWERSSVE